MPIEKTPVLSDLLLSEVLPAWSRETLPLAAAAAAVPVGTVLTVAGAALTASTTAAAAAVLIEPIKVGDTEAQVVRRGAVANADLLLWPSAATDAQIATGVAALKAAGIVPKTRI